MQPTQTEAPQYNSRRERHEAEAAADLIAHPRRDARQAMRANEYLDNLRKMTESHEANKEAFPDRPILGIVDSEGHNLFEENKPDEKPFGMPIDITNDLGFHKEIIEAHQVRVNNGDRKVIASLYENWKDAQPTDKEQIDKFAKYEMTDPNRFQKIGSFISRRVFGASQHWLDRTTLKVAEVYFKAKATADAESQNQYQEPAEDEYKKAA